jgi:Na+-driven multidrug efflux pump
MGWVIMNNMMLQTIGKSFSASLLALARQGLFLMPCLFALNRALGLTGIQISQPIADVATFALSIPLYVHLMKEMKS